MFGNNTYHFRFIVWLIVSSSPVYMSFKISFAKHFITNFPKILHFMIINRDKYHTILSQQVPCHFQSWINHIQPIGVEASVALGVRHQTVALLVKLS